MYNIIQYNVFGSILFFRRQLPLECLPFHTRCNIFHQCEKHTYLKFIEPVFADLTSRQSSKIRYVPASGLTWNLWGLVPDRLVQWRPRTLECSWVWHRLWNSAKWSWDGPAWHSRANQFSSFFSLWAPLTHCAQWASTQIAIQEPAANLSNRQVPVCTINCFCTAFRGQFPLIAWSPYISLHSHSSSE